MSDGVLISVTSNDTDVAQARIYANIGIHGTQRIEGRNVTIPRSHEAMFHAITIDINTCGIVTAVQIPSERAFAGARRRAGAGDVERADRAVPT